MRLTLLLSIGGALAQFVPAPTDLIHTTGYSGIPVRYKEVPTGICELDPNVKSYSGYADVAENEHIFFWFFEARNMDPRDAPLTVRIYFSFWGISIGYRKRIYLGCCCWDLCYML